MAARFQFFNFSSKQILRKIEKTFNLEIERKLTLEDLNNKIVSLNMINNANVKSLISSLSMNKKQQQTEDLKEIFMDLSKKVSIKNKESLNEAIVTLTELSNSTLPLRKKNLLELKNKLL